MLQELVDGTTDLMAYWLYAVPDNVCTADLSSIISLVGVFHSNKIFGKYFIELGKSHLKQTI